MRPVLGVVVADQEARALPERGGLAELPGHPGVRGMARHPDVDDAPGAERDDEIREQRAVAQVGDVEEIAGPDVLGVIAQEGAPRLPSRERGTGAAQVGLDGALGHVDAQLAELAPDPLGTPEWILGCHSPDQGDRFRRERRAARPWARLPPPKCPEARAMPAQQRLRLDDEKDPPPDADPAGEQHQERAIRRRHGRVLDTPPQHEQLLAQQRVLSQQLRAAAQ